MPAKLDLPDGVEDHLDSFYDWMDLSDSAQNNYHACMRTFYNRVGWKKGLDLQQFDDDEFNGLVHGLSDYVTSRSIKFALKKYIEYQSQQTTEMEIEQRLMFLERKIEQININEESRRDIDEKILTEEKTLELIEEVMDLNKSGYDLATFQIMIGMMYETATRASGMTRLEWRDVYRDEYRGNKLDETDIFISSNRSKSKSNRVTEISRTTYEDLMEYKDMVLDNEPDQKEKVFMLDMDRQKLYSRLYKVFKDSAENVYVPEASPHWFRHTRLTHLGFNMLEDGKNYPYIKERLRQYAGHEKSETTEIYIEILKEQQMESVMQYSGMDMDSL